MPKKVLILVEGQTEEGFIKRNLGPYLSAKEIYLYPTIIKTKKEVRGPDHKGGVNSYSQVKRDILPLLRDSSANIVTTMIDYYGLPSDFPGITETLTGSCFDKVNSLENQFGADINDHRFIPYLQLHEFESLVFACEETLPRTFIDVPAKIARVSQINTSFTSPEEINNDPTTAPSKRLKSIFPEYQKTYHSQLILSKIEIDKLRNKCTHFNEWITKIEG